MADPIIRLSAPFLSIRIRRLGRIISTGSASDTTIRAGSFRSRAYFSRKRAYCRLGMWSSSILGSVEGGNRQLIPGRLAKRCPDGGHRRLAVIDGARALRTAVGAAFRRTERGIDDAENAA